MPLHNSLIHTSGFRGHLWSLFSVDYFFNTSYSSPSDFCWGSTLSFLCVFPWCLFLFCTSCPSIIVLSLNSLGPRSSAVSAHQVGDLALKTGIPNCRAVLLPHLSPRFWEVSSWPGGYILCNLTATFFHVLPPSISPFPSPPAFASKYTVQPFRSLYLLGLWVLGSRFCPGPDSFLVSEPMSVTAVSSVEMALCLRSLLFLFLPSLPFHICSFLLFLPLFSLQGVGPIQLWPPLY